VVEESIYDLVVDELLERQSLVKAELRERFKRTKPFRQEPKSNKEMLVEYDELTPEKKQWLMQEFGAENVLPYFEKMNKIRERYVGGQ